MKKGRAERQPREVDRDTIRPEYDFSKGVRGVTAARSEAPKRLTSA